MYVGMHRSRAVQHLACFFLEVGTEGSGRGRQGERMSGSWVSDVGQGQDSFIQKLSQENAVMILPTE